VAKLVLLTLLLAVGASNFLLRGRGPFGRLLVAELLLALGLFVATGVLTSLPPPSGA
jgi:copper transport protein